MKHKPTVYQPLQTYHCEHCGSTDITPAAWCNYCGTYTTLCVHREFMEQIDDWWKNGTTGEDHEVITGLDEDSFSPENEYKTFTDACNAIWYAKSDEEKIQIWKTINHREYE